MADSSVVEMLGKYSPHFAVVGAVTVSYVALKICLSLFRFFKTYVLSRTLPLRDIFTSKGEWAVVTGATDGIGKAYAQQLAGFGMNVVLISRTESKLKDVASSIESEFKVKTKIITADFSQGSSIYSGIRIQLEGLDIGVLVNNVGLSYEFPDYFLDVPEKEKVFMDLMYVNCASVTMMSAIVLPSMVQKKKGQIINISSAAGLRPTPMLTVYSACKAYVTFLSDCLQTEYALQGINVQCVNPYFVCSNMSKVKRPSLFVPSASSYVKSALRTVPMESITLGYWPHALMDYVVGLIPFNLATKFATKGMLAASKKAKKRLAAKKAN